MQRDKVKIEQSGGNIFAALGLPDAEAHLLKAQTVTRIEKIIRQQRRTGNYGEKRIKARHMQT